jgi:hypothetical protein
LLADAQEGFLDLLTRMQTPGSRTDARKKRDQVTTALEALLAKKFDIVVAVAYNLAPNFAASTTAHPIRVLRSHPATLFPATVVGTAGASDTAHHHHHYRHHRYADADTDGETDLEGLVDDVDDGDDSSTTSSSDDAAGGAGAGRARGRRRTMRPETIGTAPFDFSAFVVGNAATRLLPNVVRHAQSIVRYGLNPADVDGSAAVMGSRSSRLADQIVECISGTILAPNGQRSIVATDVYLCESHWQRRKGGGACTCVSHRVTLAEGGGGGCVSRNAVAVVIQCGWWRSGGGRRGVGPCEPQWERRGLLESRLRRGRNRAAAAVGEGGGDALEAGWDHCLESMHPPNVLRVGLGAGGV